MSGPSWRRTSFDFAAAPRSCSRSNVPTLGISRSMMNLRNAIALLLFWGMCCPRKGSLSLAEIRESARWPPGKITTKALSRSERGSAQHSHTSCGFESLAWGRSPRADFSAAMATLQSDRSRELRLQHREQFLDVVVRVPHMRGHAHGPTAHGDVDVGRGKALRQIGRHAAAEAQSEIMARAAVSRHAGDAELGARPLGNGARAQPQRLKDAWHRPFRDQLERGFGHRHQRKVAALPDVETPRARLKVMAVVDQAC